MVEVPPSLQRFLIEIEGWLELGCAGHALKKIQMLLETPDARPAGLMLKARALIDLGQYEAALETVDESRQTYDAEPEWAHVTEAWCRKRMGDLPGAVDCMERLVGVQPHSAIGHFNLACYLCLQGERRRTLDELAVACGLDEGFRSLLANESDLDSVRDEPDFLALLPPDEDDLLQPPQ